MERIERAFFNYKNTAAIETAGTSYTYNEIEQESYAVCRYLLDLKLDAGSHIAVLTDNRYKLICTIMGIIRAGHVFIPLDSAYPLNRLCNMLHMSEVKLLFTDQTATGQAIQENVNFVQVLPFVKAEYPSESIELSGYAQQEETYLYFTSGTTGLPNAVIGKGTSLIHFTDWESETFGIGAGSRFAQLTSPCHDPFLRDIFTPFLSGGTICIPEKEHILLSSEELAEWINRTKIHIIHCTPSLFKLFNTNSSKNSYRSLRYIFLAGEQIPIPVLAKWFQTHSNHVQIINLYGPTETTLAKLYYRIHPSDIETSNKIPIGKPLPGCQVLLVDTNLHQVPDGSTGEILLQTPFMSKGYYKNPLLNSEKFIAHPFDKEFSGLIYRTGDLAYKRPDGNYVFLGRKDRQIKIRGIRIELSEIESILVQHPLIEECAVIARRPNTPAPSNEETSIYAFYTAKTLVQTSDLRIYLSKFISIPVNLIQLDTLPKTPAMKIDYLTLSRKEDIPEPNIIKANTDTQKRLVRICTPILNAKKIGITTNLLEAGLNSLRVMRLIKEIYTEFHIDISLEQLLYKPVIEHIAQLIDERKEKISDS